MFINKKNKIVIIYGLLILITYLLFKITKVNVIFLVIIIGLVLDNIIILSFFIKNNNKKQQINNTLEEDSFTLDIKKISLKNILNNEFVPYYQFIYDAKKEKYSAIEVLSRWNSPKYGIVSPAKYMDVLKNNKLIIEHDYYILEQACIKAVDWGKKGYYELNIACNFTRESLLANDFVERIESIINKYNIDINRFVFEITEDSILYDKNKAMQTIEKLDKKGFNVSIDDFASGFTSLHDIITYPANRIKIDKSIVNMTLKNPKALKLLYSLVDFSHSLNLSVVCEGIENKEVDEIVRNAGTDFIQGFYYCKPLPEEEADKFIKKLNKESK